MSDPYSRPFLEPGRHEVSSSDWKPAVVGFGGLKDGSASNNFDPCCDCAKPSPGEPMHAPWASIVCCSVCRKVLTVSEPDFKTLKAEIEWMRSNPDPAIDHPAHYNAGPIEVIDAIEAWRLNFNCGNAVKYIARADYKGKDLEDLKKAAWYLEREIKRREAVPS